MESSEKAVSNPCILLVEDDKSIALGLEYFLNQEGYSVVVCSCYKEAVTAIGNSFDLILLDLTLPDGNGYGICKKIKQKDDTPVIFLTACDDEVNVVMGLDMGADDYITKPFRVRELLSRIRTVLRRVEKTSAGRGIIEYGNIQINTVLGRVTKNGQDLFLSALEYRLFMTLINNESHILSRSQLLENIWDVSGDFVNDNTLTVYIKRLREKIEDDPQDPQIIKTARGFGYTIG